MKTLLISLIFGCLLTLSATAQVTPIGTINFLNTSTVYRAVLQTGPDRKDRINIEPNTWLVVQPKGDILPLYIGGKTYPLRFEPGKSYYFYAETGSGANNKIIERTEREFMLTAANHFVKGPVEYVRPTPANP